MTYTFSRFTLSLCFFISLSASQGTNFSSYTHIRNWIWLISSSYKFTRMHLPDRVPVRFLFACVFSNQMFKLAGIDPSRWPITQSICLLSLLPSHASQTIGVGRKHWITWCIKVRKVFVFALFVCSELNPTTDVTIMSDFKQIKCQQMN